MRFLFLEVCLIHQQKTLVFERFKKDLKDFLERKIFWQFRILKT